MQLTFAGQQKINDLAQRYAVSVDAVTTLLQAVVNGHGTMAQFYHSDLGGGGQWLQGGMTMVGDMFNHGLKAKVDGLCTELSNLLASQPFVPAPVSQQAQMQGGQAQMQGGQQQQQGGYGGYAGSPVSLFVPGAGGGSGNWWPGDLGVPSSSGSQNNVRYAYFPGTRRLAVEVNGKVSVYDTLDHQIGGVSQQQGNGTSVTFTSQYGVVSVLSLPILSGDLLAPSAPPRAAPTPAPPPAREDDARTEAVSGDAPAPKPRAPAEARPAAAGQDADIFGAIERLADLHQKGILTEQEFTAKKSELLARL
jgi:Short C-terminal domain